MLLKKLVIAEDDDAVAHLVAATLGDAGFLCLRARDGEEALNLTRSELPDALVLDVMMPRLDGITVCQRLKGDVLLSRVPILMLTAATGVDDRLMGFEAGADDYLTKPFDLREFTARVKALIRQSRRERHRNPTTNLPGSEAVEDEVLSRLKRTEDFGLLYLDIENFSLFADRQGYRRADEVIAEVGVMILREARRVADPAPFVGHVGGDDFIVICSPEIAEVLADRLRREFGALIAEHNAEGGRGSSPAISAENAAWELASAQMSVSVACLTVRPREFRDIDHLAQEVGRMKAATRRRTASGLFTFDAYKTLGD